MAFLLKQWASASALTKINQVGMSHSMKLAGFILARRLIHYIKTSFLMNLCSLGNPKQVFINKSVFASQHTDGINEVAAQKIWQPS